MPIIFNYTWNIYKNRPSVRSVRKEVSTNCKYPQIVKVKFLAIPKILKEMKRKKLLYTTDRRECWHFVVERNSQHLVENEQSSAVQHVHSWAHFLEQQAPVYNTLPNTQQCSLQTIGNSTKL